MTKTKLNAIRVLLLCIGIAITIHVAALTLPIARSVIGPEVKDGGTHTENAISPIFEDKRATPNTMLEIRNGPPKTQIDEPNEKADVRSLDELLLFFPSKYPEGNWQPAGLQFEDAWFTATDGTRLHGWYCPCHQPRAVVLFLHGNAGNLSHRAPRLMQLQKELRVASMILDYRGYGRSEGTPSVDGCLQDARAARQHLAERCRINENEIVLLGESLGGAIAVDLAARDGARGLILESTFSSLKDIAAHHYPRLAWLVPASKLNSAPLIAKYAGSLLQCHGDADRTIPMNLGRKLFESAVGTKRFVLMDGLDHNDRLSSAYVRELDLFIDGLHR